MFLNSAVSFAAQNYFVRYPHGKVRTPLHCCSSSSSYQLGSYTHGGKGMPTKGSSSSNLISSRHCNKDHQVIRAVLNMDKAENNDNQLINIMPTGTSLPVDDEQKKKKHEVGLGIENFLSGKTWFITGATGFVGKVLVEKILRSIPNTRKIYVMIKAKDAEAALHRLKTEIIEAEVFRVLKEEYGESYESFMLTKLVPVPGNLAQSPELGIHPQTADLVAREVDLIVNSAANTTFDERYDVAINTNTSGAVHLMRFADKCDNLKLFLHVSTIYANGGRNGRVLEKAFSKGGKPASSTVTPDVAAEIQLALDHSTAPTDHLKRLGVERARKFGWHETYTFTKAMGEMVLVDYYYYYCNKGVSMSTNSNKVPIVILRPSIIEGTYAHPFPGWIEGNRMLDPIAQNYSKGRMTSFPGHPNSIIDVVPVDMVVNAVLAAVTRHGAAGVADSNINTAVNVYQIGSSVSNPMTLRELFTLYYLHFNSSPILINGIPIRLTSPLNICTSIDEFSSGLHYSAGCRRGTKWRQQAIRMATFYKPYLSFMGRYDCSNTEKLMEEMSEEEREEFGFDVKSIDWKHYIAEVHLPGLRKHVMKERILAKAHVQL